MTVPLEVLNRRYVDLTLSAFPAAALDWNEFGVSPAAADPMDHAADYRTLLSLVPEGGGTDGADHQAAVLRACLRARLFDLDIGETWRHDPRFWVEDRCLAVLRAVAVSRVDEQAVDRRWLRDFVAYLPALFAASGRLLVPAEAGQVDVMNAIRQLTSALALLNADAPHLRDVPRSAVDGAAEAVTDFRRRLLTFQDGRRAVRPEARPIGPELLVAGLSARAGISVELVTLELTLDAVAGFVERPDPVPGLAASEHGLRAALADARERMSGLYPEDGCLEDLDLVAVPPEVLPNATARYSPARAPRTRGRALFVLSRYRHAADLPLDVVHECFPGHHWQYCAYQRGHDRHQPCWYYDNHAFIEGWARYCEHQYAMLADQAPVWEAFRHRLAKYAAQALAALLVHGRGARPGYVTDLLTRSRQWPPERAASLVAMAYLHPWRAAGPVCSYLALRQLAADCGDDAVRAAMSRHGIVDLSGAVVGRG